MRRARGAETSGIGLAVLVLAAMLCGGTPLAAQQSETYIGKTVASVRLELEGRALDDATLLALLDTRVGQPLRMAEVRESMTIFTGSAACRTSKSTRRSPRPRPSICFTSWSRCTASGRWSSRAARSSRGRAAG